MHAPLWTAFVDGRELDAATFSARVRQRLAQPLPAHSAHRRMAPELAYGRHSGPVPRQARPAAVLALMYPRACEWQLLLTARPTDMVSHAGQVCLPGGRVEPGETAAIAALREFHEELGDEISPAAIVGELSPVYVFVSRFLVRPSVAVVAQAPQLTPNPREVAQVLELPLGQLLDPAARGFLTINRRGLSFRTPCYHVAGHAVWGATALILAELAAVLGEETPP